MTTKAAVPTPTCYELEGIDHYVIPAPDGGAFVTTAEPHYLPPVLRRQLFGEMEEETPAAAGDGESAAAEQPKRKRGDGSVTRAKIEKALRAGQTVSQVISNLGCSKATVYRVKRELEEATS